MIRLSEVVVRAIPYEWVAAPIDRRLRAGAWVGFGLMALFLAVTFVLRATVHPGMSSPAFFIFGWGVLNGIIPARSIDIIVMGAVLLGSAATIAAWTRGFRRGPLIGHVGAMAVTIGGALAAIPLLVALVIVAINLALWVLYAVVLLLVAFLGVYMVFGGLLAALTGELS